MVSFLVTSPAQLGEMIRAYRNRRGLTQAALAAQLGLQQKAVSIAETHPERMAVSRLFELCSALRIELVMRDRSLSDPDEKGTW